MKGATATSSCRCAGFDHGLAYETGGPRRRPSPGSSSLRSQPSSAV
jgi:hypothetical protein